MKKFLLSILCCLLAVCGYAEETANLSFESKDQRTSFSTTQQVWEQNGIIFTNDKVNGSNIGNYANPVRLYQNSKIVVDCSKLGNITKIVFDCNSPSYATTLKNSIGAAATASSDKVTVTLDGSSTTFTVAKLTAQVRMDALTVTYTTGGPVTPTLLAPTMSPGTCNFYEESLVVTLSNADKDAIIYYTLDGSNPDEKSLVYDSSITISETTTIKAIATKAGANNSEIAEARYTKIEAGEGQILDVLTRELTGVNAVASYNAWEGKSSKSSAVYAGNSAGDNNSIQLRTNNNNSGIVTTVSGGKAKRIIVEWHSQTSANRTLNVYGKNTAYETAADLYNDDTDGTLLGSIKYGTSTTLDIDGDYEYIGLRSNDGAMYLTSVAIIWENESNEPVSDTWASLYLPFAVDIPGDVKAYIVTGAGSDYVSLTQITGALPAETAIIYNGDWTSNVSAEAVNEEADVTGNLLKGTFATTYITEEAYVLAKVDGEVGFYKAQMNQNEGTAWLNNSFKAYLPVSALPAAVQGANGFKFRFETTGVEGVQVTEGAKVIFDLSGRKVNDMKAPGLYIVNGKKVLVK